MEVDLKKKLELMGWVSFSIGSLIFLFDNIRQMNIVGSIGSAIFFTGCIFFIISEKYDASIKTGKTKHNKSIIWYNKKSKKGDLLWEKRENNSIIGQIYDKQNLLCVLIWRKIVIILIQYAQNTTIYRCDYITYAE